MDTERARRSSGRRIDTARVNGDSGSIVNGGSKRESIMRRALLGLAALVLIGRTGVGDPQAGQSDNLDSITAVVVGGTSLFGGRGGVVGTLIGTLIVGIFRNGLQLMGVAAIYQFLITGVLVILAVGVDQLSRRTRA